MEEDFEKYEESTDECIKFLPNRRTQIFSVFIATLGSFGLGTVYGWSSPAIPQIVESGEFGELTTDQKSYIATFALVSIIK